MSIFSHTRLPQISIITPTLNRAKLLPDAIRSVLKQTFKDWEHIIIDDGSKDNTEDVVRKFTDHRIIYVNRFKQRGISATRNLGIRLASGKYIAFLDSDDLLPPDSLAKRIRYLERHPGTALVYGRMKTLKSAEYKKKIQTMAKAAAGSQVKTYDYYDSCMQKSRSHKERFNLLLDADFSFIRTGSVMVRTTALEQTDGFDENFIVAEDYDLWLRITRQNDFHFLNDILLIYRRFEDSIYLGAMRGNTSEKFNKLAKAKQHKLK
jgi:glycosyltransferase involved in cell wall biosynthesis